MNKAARIPLLNQVPIDDWIRLQCRRPHFDSWIRRIPWRRDRPLSPVFLGFSGGSEVKNLPAMQETWVRPRGWEDTLEEGTAIHSSILAWRIPHGQRSLAGYSLWGHKESDTSEWSKRSITPGGSGEQREGVFKFIFPLCWTNTILL